MKADTFCRGFLFLYKCKGLDMPDKIITSGARIGRLTVGKVDHIKPGYFKFWECLCECGTTSIVAQTHLKTGHTQSCGCIGREGITSRNTTHGMSRTPEYNSWRSIKERCTNPLNVGWDNYGGRGVAMCEQWSNSFEQFLADMGLKPFKGAQVDRIDNNQGYYPGNCQWLSPKDNSRKKSNSVFVTLYGEKKCLAEWAEITGVRYQTLVRRFNSGISAEQILYPGDKRGRGYA